MKKKKLHSVLSILLSWVWRKKKKSNFNLNESSLTSPKAIFTNINEMVKIRRCESEKESSICGKWPVSVGDIKRRYPKRWGESRLWWKWPFNNIKGKKDKAIYRRLHFFSLSLSFFLWSLRKGILKCSIYCLPSHERDLAVRSESIFFFVKWLWLLTEMKLINVSILQPITAKKKILLIIANYLQQRNIT